MPSLCLPAERYSCASSQGGVVWEPLLSPAHTSGVAVCLSAVLPSDGELGVEAEILAHVIYKRYVFSNTSINLAHFSV